MMNEIFTSHKRPRRIVALAAPVGWILALFICATAFPVQSKATAHQKPDWGDQIVPSSRLTVLDLTRRLLPDIKQDSATADKITATDLSGIRLLDGVEATGMELDLESDDEHEITESDYFWLKDGGNRFLVLLLTVDGEKIVVALFKISPAVTLLDAVTVAQDVHVDVNRERVWLIHPRHQAFAAHSWHDNSSESFDQYTFISVVDGKLRAVATPGSFEGFTDYSPARQRVCKTALSPEFRFVRSTHREYFDLIVSEKTLKVCHRDSEKWSWNTGIIYKKSVRRLWHWSAKNKQYRRASTRSR
ncbi:MAG TPA: hypothetical protein VLG74_15980 [Blastocatellia bacterium]|nr:hypothetical protein [Blastocatellia bacterium]